MVSIIISVQMTETAGIYQDCCPRATVVLISMLYTRPSMQRCTTEHPQATSPAYL